MKEYNSHMKKGKKRKVFLILPLIVLAAGLLYIIRQLREPAGQKFESYLHISYEETDWMTILVNADHPLPENYSVSLLRLDNGEYIDERIWPDLQDMFDTARSEGIDLYVRSGWRSYEDQQAVMDEMISSYMNEGYSENDARRAAGEWVALPGTSEHETGLAVDINSENDENSWRTYNWLMDNAHLYGFIQRYPDEKSSLTGIAYEPWHYRYVGKEAALEIYESGICLEEYQSSHR